MNLTCITAVYDPVRYMEIRDWLDEHTPNWMHSPVVISSETPIHECQIEYRFTQPEHAIMFTLRWI